MDIFYSHKHSNKSRKTSNKKYRLRTSALEKFPDGYVEDWNNLSKEAQLLPIFNLSKNDIVETTSILNTDNRSVPVLKSNLNTDQSISMLSERSNNVGSVVKSVSNSNLNIKDNLVLLSESKKDTLSNSEAKQNINYKFGSTVNNFQIPEITEQKSNIDIINFKPVSIILSTQDNILLNKENNYEVKFSTGMIEGDGININERGDLITFKYDGSYRFEICGEAILFSDVDVNLIYDSDKFSTDIKQFSIIKIPKDEGKLQLRGIPTILPLQKNQTIRTRLLPIPEESIVLLGGTRLLIHRVA